MTASAFISLALEGDTDEPVALKLLAHAGAAPGPVHGRTGKADLKRRIRGFAAAAQHSPWLVLVDLDHEFGCAANLRAAWLPTSPPHLPFRVAVRAIEAWLLADAQAIARFLRVSHKVVPADPEHLPQPKRVLVDLAGRSSSREVRDAMQPRAGSGRAVGPLYASKIIEFARDHWSVARAATRSDSLARAVRCLERLVSSGAAL